MANTTTEESPWQERLAATCRSYGYSDPSYQEYSDRRGGRTAWSCLVVVNGKQYTARNWYDGRFINGAREDAAEVALLAMSGAAPGDG